MSGTVRKKNLTKGCFDISTDLPREDAHDLAADLARRAGYHNAKRVAAARG